MIIEPDKKSVTKPRSGGIIMPCLRHFRPLFIQISYNPFMPSALMNHYSHVNQKVYPLRGKVNFAVLIYNTLSATRRILRRRFSIVDKIKLQVPITS